MKSNSNLNVENIDGIDEEDETNIENDEDEEYLPYNSNYIYEKKFCLFCDRDFDNDPELIEHMNLCNDK